MRKPKTRLRLWQFCQCLRKRSKKRWTLWTRTQRILGMLWTDSSSRRPKSSRMWLKKLWVWLDEYCQSWFDSKLCMSFPVRLGRGISVYSEAHWRNWCQPPHGGHQRYSTQGLWEWIWWQWSRHLLQPAASHSRNWQWQGNAPFESKSLLPVWLCSGAFHSLEKLGLDRV